MTSPVRDVAYIVAPVRRDKRAPSLSKAVAPPQGSDLCVWLDRWHAEKVRDGLNAQCARPVWGVFEIQVEVKP